eukprot:TRINITY_DN11765_c0_g2_i3.p1 TRINITY_DN11765_c0_g2~~TRINITY_DN11765_c0_g2_i3.p1  ORF type:complete len:637 (-),score=70.64 TRINITY_DN11765_c0_g2_i3:1355-3118(-)
MVTEQPSHRSESRNQLFLRRAFLCKDAQQQLDASASGNSMKKVLGPVDLTLMGIGAIIGSGVFVLTGLAANKYSGPAVWLSYLISSLAAAIAALCFAEFGSEIPAVGGPFNYVVVTFGELPAWLCASALWLEHSVGTAAIARGFTSYFASIFGLRASDLRIGVNSFISFDFIALGINIVMCLLLAKGMKESSVVNHVISGINLLVILLIVFVGIAHVNTDNYTPFAPFGVEGIFTGASAVFFSFLGFNNLASAAEELRNPVRDLPIGILTSISVCTVLYILMCVTITGMQPYDQIDQDAPFSIAFHNLGVEWARTIIAIGAVTGIATSFLVNMLGYIRLIVILARSYLLPTALAKVNANTQTPIKATILASIVGGSISLIFDLEILSKVVSAGALFVFLLVCLGIVYRKYNNPDDVKSQKALNAKVLFLVLNSIGFGLSFGLKAPVGLTITFGVLWVVAVVAFYWQPVQYIPSQFRVPFNPFLPCLGVLAMVVLIASLGKWAQLMLSSWLILSFVIYYVYGVKRAQEHDDFHQQQKQGNDKENNGSKSQNGSLEMQPLEPESIEGQQLLRFKKRGSSDKGNMSDVEL